MRLDASKLDLNNPRVHRKDLDFAVTWAKMYGKGRVFYSTLGHVEQNWDDPRIQRMYVEAIKWAMGLVNADVTPRPAPAQSRALSADVTSKSTLLGKWSNADVSLGASVSARTACIARTWF
jgi:type 1 glutamine amidotransferase